MAGTLAIPRIVVGAATSGAGKTTIAAGLMAALTARGLVVQPFKVGPDFIDPTHHTRCCGRACRNLDPFMMGEDGVCETFVRASAGADIAVIEGVMGLHDGVDGTVLGSTAHVARLLESPVLLAVDAKGASRTVHAVVRGVAGYNPDVRVAGVVFNRIGSARHRELIERGRELPVLGWIPRDDALAVPSRHLGLSLADELASHDAFGDVVGAHVDLDGVIAIARSAPSLAVLSTAPAAVGDIVIGVALDRSFCFYYADNLDRLREAGANLVFFSPEADDLPDVNALYIGGGYPELHASGLEAGRARPAIARAATDGMPIWGECGGLVYLSRSLEAEGRSHRMCGVLPADSAMTGGIRGLGYVDGTFVAGPFQALHGVACVATSSTTRTAHPMRTRGMPSPSRAGAASATGGMDSASPRRSPATPTRTSTDRFCSALVGAARAYSRR